MKFYEIQNQDLVLKSRADLPCAGEGERLIEVRAFGINRADILQIAGKYDAPDGSQIPGLEIAGVDANTGETVVALLPSSGYATHVIAKNEWVVPMPANLSFTEAAALPEALVTCYQNLVVNCGLSAGETVLINGAGSGIGTMALQMSRALGAGRIIGTVSDLSKAERLCALGATEIYNYSALPEDLKSSVDVVLDVLSGDYTAQNLNTMRYGGRMAVIAVMAGANSTINMAQLLMRNLTIKGSTLRSQSDAKKAQLIGGAFSKFNHAITEGAIAPVVDCVYNFQEIHQALNRIKSRSHIGKVVLDAS